MTCKSKENDNGGRSQWCRGWNAYMTPQKLTHCHMPNNSGQWECFEATQDVYMFTKWLVTPSVRGWDIRIRVKKPPKGNTYRRDRREFIHSSDTAERRSLDQEILQPSNIKEWSQPLWWRSVPVSYGTYWCNPRICSPDCHDSRCCPRNCGLGIRGYESSQGWLKYTPRVHRWEQYSTRTSTGEFRWVYYVVLFRSPNTLYKLDKVS
jgi:hypothetical protein